MPSMPWTVTIETHCLALDIRPSTVMACAGILPQPQRPDSEDKNGRSWRTISNNSVHPWNPQPGRDEK